MSSPSAGRKKKSDTEQTQSESEKSNKVQSQFGSEKQYREQAKKTTNASSTLTTEVRQAPGTQSSSVSRSKSVPAKEDCTDKKRSSNENKKEDSLDPARKLSKEADDKKAETSSRQGRRLPSKELSSRKTGEVKRSRSRRRRSSSERTSSRRRRSSSERTSSRRRRSNSKRSHSRRIPEVKHYRNHVYQTSNYLRRSPATCKAHHRREQGRREHVRNVVRRDHSQNRRYRERSRYDRRHSSRRSPSRSHSRERANVSRSKASERKRKDERNEPTENKSSAEQKAQEKDLRTFFKDFNKTLGSKSTVQTSVAVDTRPYLKLLQPIPEIPGIPGNPVLHQQKCSEISDARRRSKSQPANAVDMPMASRGPTTVSDWIESLTRSKNPVSITVHNHIRVIPTEKKIVTQQLEGKPVITLARAPPRRQYKFIKVPKSKCITETEELLKEVDEVIVDDNVATLDQSAPVDGDNVEKRNETAVTEMMDLLKKSLKGVVEPTIEPENTNEGPSDIKKLMMRKRTSSQPSERETSERAELSSGSSKFIPSFHHVTMEASARRWRSLPRTSFKVLAQNMILKPSILQVDDQEQPRLRSIAEIVHEEHDNVLDNIQTEKDCLVEQVDSIRDQSDTPTKLRNKVMDEIIANSLQKIIDAVVEMSEETMVSCEQSPLVLTPAADVAQITPEEATHSTSVQPVDHSSGTSAEENPSHAGNGLRRSSRVRNKVNETALVPVEHRPNWTRNVTRPALLHPVSFFPGLLATSSSVTPVSHPPVVVRKRKSGQSTNQAIVPFCGVSATTRTHPISHARPRLPTVRAKSAIPTTKKSRKSRQPPAQTARSRPIARRPPPKKPTGKGESAIQPKSAKPKKEAAPKTAKKPVGRSRAPPTDAAQGPMTRSKSKAALVPSDKGTSSKAAESSDSKGSAQKRHKQPSTSSTEVVKKSRK